MKLHWYPSDAAMWHLDYFGTFRGTWGKPAKRGRSKVECGDQRGLCSTSGFHEIALPPAQQGGEGVAQSIDVASIVSLACVH